MPTNEDVSAVDKKTDESLSSPQHEAEAENSQRKITELGQANSDLKRMVLESAEREAFQKQRLDALEMRLNSGSTATHPNPQENVDPKNLIYDNPEQAILLAQKQGANAVLESLKPVIGQVDARLNDTQGKLNEQKFYEDYPDVKAYIKDSNVGKTAKNIVYEIAREVNIDILNRGLSVDELNNKIAKLSRIRFQRELRPIETPSIIHSGGSSISDRKPDTVEEYTKEDGAVNVMSARNRMTR